MEISPLHYVCSSLYPKTNVHMVIRFSLSVEDEVATAAERHLRANPPGDSSMDNVQTAFASCGPLRGSYSINSHMGIDYLVKRNIRVLDLALYTGDFVQYFSFMKSAGCPFFSVVHVIKWTELS